MTFASALQHIIHEISQSLLNPTMVILIALAVYAIWCIGSIITEIVTDRRHYKGDMVHALGAIDAARFDELPYAINSSGLLRKHKLLLLELAGSRVADADARTALARTLLSDAEAHYSRIVSRMELIAKVAPMVGLMGTLIPLGPGITAMNAGDLVTLSDALNIAFDTTVMGLVTAIVAMVVVRFRRHWYEEYLVRLDAMMTAIVAKAEKEPVDAPCADGSHTAARARRAA